jgi:hypothetical protein
MNQPIAEVLADVEHLLQSTIKAGAAVRLNIIQK